MFNCEIIEFCLTLWHSLLPYGYSYKASCARPGEAVICNFWPLAILMVSPECQSAWISKITNDGLTQPGTGCWLLVFIWQGLWRLPVMWVEMVWACVMLLLLSWLCSEWTDNFPYDFRDERMSKCLKDMTQLLINIYPELRRDVSILMHNLLSKVWSLVNSPCLVPLVFTWLLWNSITVS